MRFSVALCTFRGEVFLGELLDSLVAQDRRPDELVAVDDASPDDTVEVLKAFAEAAPFPVRIEVNDRTLGATKNFERAIALCTGEAIALCDQDDVWLPTKLARLDEALAADEEVGFVFSDGVLVDEELRPLGRRLWEAFGFDEERRRLAAAGDLVEVLVDLNVATGATMAIRSSLVPLVLPIPSAWPHDAWIALLGAFFSPSVMIEESLIRYRVHPGQEIGVPASLERMTRGGLRWRASALDLRHMDQHRSDHREQAERWGEVVDHVRKLQAGEGLEELPVRTARTLHELEDRVRHDRHRGWLPERRLARLGPIIREWRRGGYQRFSDGLLSALKDLV